MEQNKLTSNEEIIGFLCESFPLCFFNGNDVKPLKIGIFRDVADRLVDEQRVSNRYLRIALRHYTNSWRYLSAVVEDASRIDLDGNEVESVSAQHAEHAAQQLKESKERAAEKRKQKAKESKSKLKFNRKPSGKPDGKIPIKHRKSKLSKPTIVRSLSQDELKSGVRVSVKLGKQPMEAVITEVAKDGVTVQLNSGMTVKVQESQLKMVANKR
ncbi:MAG: RNA chaperone ProQ [Pseudomonadota bacterium]